MTTPAWKKALRDATTMEEAFAILGSLGGKARAKKLTPEKRSAIAKKASKARWDKHFKREQNV